MIIVEQCLGKTGRRMKHLQAWGLLASHWFSLIFLIDIIVFSLLMGRYASHSFSYILDFFCDFNTLLVTTCSSLNLLLHFKYVDALN